MKGKQCKVIFQATYSTFCSREAQGPINNAVALWMPKNPGDATFAGNTGRCFGTVYAVVEISAYNV